VPYRLLDGEVYKFGVVVFVMVDEEFVGISDAELFGALRDVDAVDCSSGRYTFDGESTVDRDRGMVPAVGSFSDIPQENRPGLIYDR